MCPFFTDKFTLLYLANYSNKIVSEASLEQTLPKILVARIKNRTLHLTPPRFASPRFSGEKMAHERERVRHVNLFKHNRSGTRSTRTPPVWEVRRCFTIKVRNDGRGLFRHDPAAVLSRLCAVSSSSPSSRHAPKILFSSTFPCRARNFHLDNPGTGSTSADPAEPGRDWRGQRFRPSRGTRVRNGAIFLFSFSFFFLCIFCEFLPADLEIVSAISFDDFFFFGIDVGFFMDGKYLEWDGREFCGWWFDWFFVSLLVSIVENEESTKLWFVTVIKNIYFLTCLWNISIKLSVPYLEDLICYKSVLGYFCWIFLSKEWCIFFLKKVI